MRRALLLVLLAACAPGTSVTHDPGDEGTGGTGGSGGEGGGTGGAVCPPALAPTTDSRLVWLQQLLAKAVKPGAVIQGAAAVVVHGNEVLPAMAGGLVGDCSLRTDTPLPLGDPLDSLVEALVALRLENAKAVDLDAPIDGWMPGYELPPRLTLRLLLQHRGGVASSTPNQEPCFENSPRQWIRQVPPQAWFSPGQYFMESVPGLRVSIAALEEKAGQDFPDLASRWVFAPLGMTGASYGPAQATLHGLQDPVLLASCPDSAGRTLFLSVEDMGKLLATVSGDAFLGASRHLLYDGSPNPEFPGVERGLAMAVTHWNPKTRALPYAVFGQTFGVCMAWAPDAGVALAAAVTSATGQVPDPAALVDATQTLCSDLMDHEVGAFNEPTPPYPVAEDYLGAYANPLGVGRGPRTLQVVGSGNQLFLQSGDSTWPLSWFGVTDAFYVGPQDQQLASFTTQVRFWRDFTGQVNAITSFGGELGPPAYR